MKRTTMAIAVVCVLALSFVASAGIVNYLSNQASDTVTVMSPITVEVCNHPGFSTTFGDWSGWDGEISDNGLFYSGSAGMFWARADNNANLPIDGTVRITLTCWNGISSTIGEEFDVITVNDYVTPLTGGAVDLKTLGTWSLGNTDGVSGYDHLYVDIPFTGFASESSEIAELYFEMNPYAVGIYTISFQIV